MAESFLKIVHKAAPPNLLGLHTIYMSDIQTRKMCTDNDKGKGENMYIIKFSIRGGCDFQ